MAPLHDRKNFQLMPPNQMLIRQFIIVCVLVFHPIFFGEAFHLSVTEHGQAGKVDHNRADAKIFVAIAKLLDGGLLIGIVHEVDVALENLRVKLQRVLDGEAILGIVFVAQHVHETREL